MAIRQARFSEIKDLIKNGYKVKTKDGKVYTNAPAGFTPQREIDILRVVKQNRLRIIALENA